MPPLVATSRAISPVIQAPLGVSEIWIDGKPFRVKQLGSKVHAKSPYEEETKAISLKSRIKKLPDEVRKEFRAAEKLFKLPTHLQRRKLEEFTRARKEAALRDELGMHHLKAATKALYAERLAVTEEEMRQEEGRLQALVAAVEGGAS